MGIFIMAAQQGTFAPSNRRMKTTPLLFATLLIAACSTEPATTDPTGGTTSGAALPNTDPIKERDAWQKPEELIQLMGGDLSGMTIVDLFAADGYFTFKMIEAGANVIAVVNDPVDAERIEARKRELNLGDDRLKVRTVPVGDPGIGPNEADMALIAHRFLTITDKGSYFDLLRRGLREPRPLYMLEWQARQTPMGPPVSERRSVEDIMDMVGLLGYSDVGAHSAKIPDQVIFIITDYIDLEGSGM